MQRVEAVGDVALEAGEAVVELAHLRRRRARLRERLDAPQQLEAVVEACSGADSERT